MAFLSAGQIAKIRGLVTEGYETAEHFFDVQIQPRRRNGTSGLYANHGPVVSLVKIGFGLREVSQETGTPITTRSSDGDMSFWAGDYDARNGDRFQYRGGVVEITAVYPEQFGVITCEIKLIQGS